MRTRTWCVAGALLCLASPAAAQTVLSEADVLAQLSADSPRLRAIRAAIDVARREGMRTSASDHFVQRSWNSAAAHTHANAIKLAVLVKAVN